MNFSEWRRLQRDTEMFKISEVFVAEGIGRQHFEKIVHTFLPFVKKELNIKELPKIHFIDDPKFAKRIAAFGQIKDNRIVIDIQGRHTMDILRTLAHEISHYRQHKLGIHGASKVGSPTENEANKLAGNIVRKFGEKHPSLFATSALIEAKKRGKKVVVDNSSDNNYDHYPVEII